MNQRPRKSIDGILSGTGQRNVYIAKQKPKDLPERTFSVQPRNVERTTALAGKQPRNKFGNNDLVVKLPRSRVIYARVFSLLQYLALAFAALFSAGNTTIGQYLIAIFAVYVLVLRKNSQKTFIIALILLVSIPIFQVLKQPGIAENMAIYTYELLVVGTIQAIIELKWPKQKQHGV
jgi:hypothetical protein